jgi:hypothetical protein
MMCPVKSYSTMAAQSLARQPSEEDFAPKVIRSSVSTAEDEPADTAVGYSA